MRIIPVAEAEAEGLQIQDLPVLLSKTMSLNQQTSAVIKVSGGK